MSKPDFRFLITKSISKIFIPNFVCVLTNQRYKTYQMGFLFCRLGRVPGAGFGALGVSKGSKIYFFKHGHGQAEQNASKVFILGSNR